MLFLDISHVLAVSYTQSPILHEFRIGLFVIAGKGRGLRVLAVGVRSKSAKALRS